MQTVGYEIKLEQFEGPFDLLLFFIERDELNIHDIPISKITDDFLSYVQHMHALNIELASEFIFVASTLMRIKAKMLIPRPDAEDAENEIDLKEDLVQKLILYKQFKEVCADIQQLEERRRQIHSRGNIAFDQQQALSTESTEQDLSSFDLYSLMMVYEKVMSSFSHRIKEQAITHTVIKYPYTIEQQKKALIDLMELNEKIDFQLIAQSSENKVQFVYNFLALLEMLQQKLLAIEMGTGFNSFTIARAGSVETADLAEELPFPDND